MMISAFLLFVSPFSLFSSFHSSVGWPISFTSGNIGDSLFLFVQFFIALRFLI